MFLPASSSMWMRVRRTARASPCRRNSTAPPSQIGSSYCEIWIALRQVRIEVVLAREAAALADLAADRQPQAHRRSTAARFSTGSVPGQPQADRIGRACSARRRTPPTTTRRSSTCVASCTCTSSPMTASYFVESLTTPSSGGSCSCQSVRALVGAGDAKQVSSPSAGADELQADRQARLGEPAGLRQPGTPARSAPTVSTSARYICSGSPIFSPSLNAGTGDVGVTITSHARERRREVVGDQRAHVLRLAVVGVVVAGAQHVRAEHDAALRLGAEALAARLARTSPPASARPAARWP